MRLDDSDDSVDQAPTSLEPANGTLTVTDCALVTVTGITYFTGEVEFHLCGPFAAGATTLCDSGGVAAGTKPVTARRRPWSPIR